MKDWSGKDFCFECAKILGASCLLVWLAVKGYLAYLNRLGIELFGWYRIALAAVIGGMLWI